MSQYIRWPAGGSGSGIATYATYVDLPPPILVENGTLAIVLDTDTLYIFSSADNNWDPIGSPGAMLTIGPIDSQPKSINGAVDYTNQLVLQTANDSHPGLISTGAQNIGGNKTFFGTITASNLSGTNTGDQTITLTGDVTGSGTGSFAATIAANAVTNAKLAQAPTLTLKGNNTGGTANVLDLTVAQVNTMLGTTGSATSIGTYEGGTANAKGLTLSGNVLFAQSATTSFPGMVNTTTQSFAGAKTFTGTIAASNFSGTSSGTNTGDQTITLTSDVTGSGTGSFATTIASNVVTNAKLAQMATLTIKGNNTGGTSNALDLTVSQVNTMLGTLANPMTTLGDLIYGASAGAATRLAGQTTTAKQYLSQTGTGSISAVPAWATISATTDLTGTLPITNGGTGQTSANAALNAFLPTQTSNAGASLVTDGTNTSWVQASPSGMISMYGGQTAPTGWLLCDGSAVSRTTYANLFTAIGSAHGYGDGSTTFNVPDMRGRFPRGVSGTATTDPNKTTRTANVAGTHTATGNPNSTTTISGFSTTANIAPGMTITGTGITAGTLVSSITNTTTIVITVAASNTTTGITYTFSNSATGNFVGSAQTNATAKNGLAIVDPGHAHSISSGAGGGASPPLTQVGSIPAGATDNATTGISLGAGDSETRPTNLYVNFIIKT